MKSKEIPVIICFANSQSWAPRGSDGAMGWMNFLFRYSRNIAFATEEGSKDMPECPVIVGKKTHLCL